MLPTNPGGHAAYQDTFVSDFLKFYPDPFVLPKSTWDYIVQFWYLDFSQTDSIMQECYSVFGPEPRLPSCMLRSYLLALKLKVTSITRWCRMLRETPLYAILSGFSFGDTPGVGTFYDFFSRIWQNDNNNLSPKDRFPKMKPPKLIDPDHLALAGDGTPVRTAAQQRKKRICDCKEKGCLPAVANAIISSRTATGDGTPTWNATSSVTTSTCMWPPIPTAISLYFPFWKELPA